VGLHAGLKEGVWRVGDASPAGSAPGRAKLDGRRHRRASGPGSRIAGGTGCAAGGPDGWT
jgi:hypothetical protein